MFNNTSSIIYFDFEYRWIFITYLGKLDKEQQSIEEKLSGSRIFSFIMQSFITFSVHTYCLPDVVVFLFQPELPLTEPHFFEIHFFESLFPKNYLFSPET